MPILNNIDGGTKPIGKDNNSGFVFVNYNQTNKNNKNNFFRLRVAEILQGLILENPVENIAEVRLPVGIFRAYLQGNLKKGDELFFKIDSVQPNLILKIHSVYLYKLNKKYSEKEIIRILDLPENDLFIKLINEYSNIKSILIRDEILLSYNLLNKYFINNNENNSNEDTIRTAIFFIETNINDNREDIELIYNYFKNKTSYLQGLENIKNNIDKLNKNLETQFLNFLNNNPNSLIPLKRISVVI